MASSPLNTPPRSPFQHQPEISQLPSCHKVERYMTSKISKPGRQMHQNV